MALESDNLRIHLFASVFLPAGPEELDPFLDSCLQYIVPELVVSQNDAAIKCLTRIKAQQDVRELQIQQREQNSDDGKDNYNDICIQYFNSFIFI